MALRVDKFGKGLLVVVLKLVRRESGAPLVDDMLRQIEHVFRYLHILDVIEVLVLRAAGLNKRAEAGSFAKMPVLSKGPPAPPVPMIS